jgi:hypothetical protein
MQTDYSFPRIGIGSRDYRQALTKSAFGSLDYINCHLFTGPSLKKTPLQGQNHLPTYPKEENGDEYPGNHMINSGAG